MDDLQAYLIEHGIRSVIFWIVGIILVWLSLGLFGLNIFGQFPRVPKKEWQAVFLTNDQVYFGHLRDYSDTYVTLHDVYYLKTAADLESQKDESNFNLIKLGGELHGPDDRIFIPKESILFWENMKETSRVVQSIESAKQ